jgi:hypothetical protein
MVDRPTQTLEKRYYGETGWIFLLLDFRFLFAIMAKVQRSSEVTPWLPALL